jgi:hypothetical protein
MDPTTVVNRPKTSPADDQSTAQIVIEKGICQAIYVYDIGHSIDLNAAETRSAQSTEREPIRHKRKAPRYFEYQPNPLRILQSSAPIQLGGFKTSIVDCLVYDFGAVSVTYEIDIAGPLGSLAALSDQLYESRLLQDDSRALVEQMVRQLDAAITEPTLSPLVEDYVIYQIDRLKCPLPLNEMIARHSQQLAQILRSEQQQLSDQEVTDALSHRISFGTNDVTIIDWQAALVIDQDAEDVRAVLEFANVELLEMRHLDDQLDRVLNQSYRTLSRQNWKHLFSFRQGASQLRRLAKLQMDSAVLFEEVNNSLKLLGDQYLARVYRLVSQRMHIGDWDASILRKLQTADSIYSKLSDYQSARRMEILEWIIIILIALSTVLALLPGLSH